MLFPTVFHTGWLNAFSNTAFTRSFVRSLHNGKYLYSVPLTPYIPGSRNGDRPALPKVPLCGTAKHAMLRYGADFPSPGRMLQFPSTSARPPTRFVLDV